LDIKYLQQVKFFNILRLNFDFYQHLIRAKFKVSASAFIKDLVFKFGNYYQTT